MIGHLFEFLREALIDMLPLDLGGGSPHARAYRNAWKRRIETNDASTVVLENALKEHSVPGAYGPHDAPAVVFMYRAWAAGLSPSDARRSFGRKFDGTRSN